MPKIVEMMQAFKAAYPEWSGVPLEPSESVHLMLNILDKVTPEDTGKFISHKASLFLGLYRETGRSCFRGTISRETKSGSEGRRWNDLPLDVFGFSQEKYHVDQYEIVVMKRAKWQNKCRL